MTNQSENMNFTNDSNLKDRDRKLLVFIFGLISVAIIFSIWLETYIPLLFPTSVLGIGLLWNDYRKLFYILFMVLPFSIEIYFEALGLGTDLPSEPMMIVLAGITFVFLLKENFTFKMTYLWHPVTLFLTFHIVWIFITSINSQNSLISYKFFLAKVWYILPFFIFPLVIFKESVQFEKAYRILYIFLFYAISIVLIRHAFEDFSFAASYDVVRPFFRNHVSYAAISVVCLPFVWAFLRINKMNNISNKWMMFVFIIFIIGIYFSYTRAAILSMLIAVGAWYIIKLRWVKQSLLISSIIAVIGIIYLSWDNKYMDFAPDFEKTITHTEFDNLLEATYKLEDISSMERVYRWMAGIEMIKDRFWLGFGPGTFYSNYQSYSISRFQTYVSNNPEKSGIHNYFLMTWVEQGLIGFLIFIALCFTLLISGENVYHRSTDERDKYIIMASTLGFIIIFAMCLINDLIETDKVGPFFFLNAAILLFYSDKYKSVNQSPK
jgi:O-antigen ligase